MVDSTVQYTAANDLWAWKPESARESVSKPVGVTLDIADVSYTVKLEGKYKRLLRNVNFHLDPVSSCLLKSFIV